MDPSQNLLFGFLVEVLLWHQMGVISSDKSFKERAPLPKLNTVCFLLPEHPFHTYPCLAGLYIGMLKRWNSSGDIFRVTPSLSLPIAFKLISQFHTHCLRRSVVREMLSSNFVKMRSHVEGVVIVLHPTATTLGAKSSAFSKYLDEFSA